MALWWYRYLGCTLLSLRKKTAPSEWMGPFPFKPIEGETSPRSSNCYFFPSLRRRNSSIAARSCSVIGCLSK